MLRKGRLRDDTVDQAVASIRRLGHRRRVLLLETDDDPAPLDLRGRLWPSTFACRLFQNKPA
eukprot:13198229-Alexandrium_andersonii.AAC.1